MPYDVLEQKIKSLPEVYYNELIDFLDYLTQKANQVNKEKTDADSLQKMRESSLQTAWDSVKNNTWWYLYVGLRVPFGSEFGYRRPVVVIPLTSNTITKDLHGNIFILKVDSGLSKDSVALVYQIIVVDKFRLDEKISKLLKSLIDKFDFEIDYVKKINCNIFFITHQFSVIVCQCFYYFIFLSIYRLVL